MIRMHLRRLVLALRVDAASTKPDRVIRMHPSAASTSSSRTSFNETGPCDPDAPVVPVVDDVARRASTKPDRVIRMHHAYSKTKRSAANRLQRNRTV